MSKHFGDLTITASNKNKYLDLVEVTGSLVIRADASLPVLTTVGGTLYINADASLPVLATVGGYLEINADASLPVLTTVGGTLYINADASLPVLATVGGYLEINADASLPVLTTVGGTLYIRADGKFNAPCLAVSHGNKGALLGISGYGLWRSDDGYYFAGCRGPLNAEQALAHWDRSDDRALLFTAIINAAEIVEA